MIEVLSRRNKSSCHAIRSFLDKAVASLDSGINLLLVDVYPPGARDPGGIHGALLNEISTEEYVLGRERPLTAAAYIGGMEVQAFVNHFAVGEPIPEMPLCLSKKNYVRVRSRVATNVAVVRPLCLSKKNYVRVPLEAAYMAAWEDVPPQYQEALLASTPL